MPGAICSCCCWPRPPRAASAQLARANPTDSKKGGIAYRWVDEQGIVHYGDHIPPQYAAQDRSVLNADGIEVSHLDAQKSPEQARRGGARRGRTCSSSASTTASWSRPTPRSRTSSHCAMLRLEQLQGQRAASEQYVESLRARLRHAAGAFADLPAVQRECARACPMTLAENLVRTLNELRQQTAALAATKRAGEGSARGSSTPTSSATASCTPSTRSSVDGQCRPEWPKPPAPRSDAANSSTISSSTCTTGTTTSCAMRSPGLDRERLRAAVPARHHQLSLVVRVDQPDEVAEHDAVLVAESRARQDHRREPGSPRGSQGRWE